MFLKYFFKVLVNQDIFSGCARFCSSDLELKQRKGFDEKNEV